MMGSQFDGGAAFSGGGFMPSQATQTADPTGFSPSKNRDTQSLLPLTVKQINDAFLSSDEKFGFVIDGVDVNNVTLVGMVFNVAGRITDFAFVLDDCTGRVDCVKWISDPEASKEAEGITNGIYVRVHGHLKGFQGKRTLNVFSIRPVTDFNEITSHFVECIYVHHYNTKLRKLQAGIASQPQMNNSMNNTPIKGNQSAPSNQFSGQYSFDGLSNIGQQVLEYLQLPSSLEQERGVHVDELARQLKISREKIGNAISSLEGEGLVYSTVDEYHYKSTVNG